MAWSVMINDDFTLEVEEDVETDFPDETIQIKTETEWKEADIEFGSDGDINVKEEVDIEDSYFNVDQYVDLNQIKTEIQFEYDDAEIGPEEEIPPVAGGSQLEIPTKDTPIPPFEDISTTLHKNVPEQSNITPDTKLDEEDIPKAQTGSDDFDKILDEEKNPIVKSKTSREPLDRRKPKDESPSQPLKVSPKKSKPDTLQNENISNNNRQLVPWRPVPKQRKSREEFRNDPSSFSRSQHVPKVPENNRYRGQNNRNGHLKRLDTLVPKSFFHNKFSHSRKNRRRRNKGRRHQIFKNPSLAIPPLLQNQYFSYNQTYSTILNVINQALGQQRNQNLQNFNTVSHFPNNQMLQSQWKYPVTMPPTVWASDLGNKGPTVNSSQVQTYLTIFQAVTQFGGGVLNQNFQNWTCLNTNNFQMSFQSSFGQFTNYLR